MVSEDIPFLIKTWVLWVPLLPPLPIVMAIRLISSNLQVDVAVPVWRGVHTRRRAIVLGVGLLVLIPTAVYSTMPPDSSPDVPIRVWQFLVVVIGPLTLITAFWLICLFDRCIVSIKVVLAQLVPKETVEENVEIHNLVRERVEEIRHRTHSFLAVLMAIFGICLVHGVFGVLLHPTGMWGFVKSIFLIGTLIPPYFILEALTSVNEAGIRFREELCLSLRDSPHRLYGLVKLMEMNPVQYELCGVVVTKGLLVAYVVTAFTGAAASAFGYLLTLAREGYA